MVSVVNLQNPRVSIAIGITLLIDHNRVLYRNICPTGPR